MKKQNSSLGLALSAAVFTVAAIASTGAAAQDQRYQSWQDPAQAASPAQTGLGDTGKELLGRLDKLVTDAEKARAGDPRFLRDLRALIRDFDRPWKKVLAEDSFQDGDYTSGPAWQLASGEFWIERGYGLRSAIEPKAEPAASSGNSGNKDVAVQIFGSILNQALGGKSNSGSAPAAAATEAEIRLPMTITNAFALTAEIASWKPQGQVVLGVYQGAQPTGGYQVSYYPGAKPSMELISVGSRGASVVATSNDKVTLEDNKVHTLVWTRAPDGTMVVSIDGTEVMRATDRRFSDSFNGLSMINKGGDYTLRRVLIEGTS